MLIVDDEDDIRELLRMEFELEGYEIFESSNGDEAVEFLLNNPIDFVVSDIRMPKLNGMEMLVRIRQTHPKFPLVVLMSGFSDFTEADAIKSGALKLFNKPFDIDRLLKLAAEAL